MTKPEPRRELDPPLEQLPNIGPIVAARLCTLGIRTRSELEVLGPVEAYRRLRSALGVAPSIRHYLFGLDAALLGVPVRDLPRSRRSQLVRAVLDLPDLGPTQPIRTRLLGSSRRRRGRKRAQRGTGFPSTQR